MEQEAAIRMGATDSLTPSYKARRPEYQIQLRGGPLVSSLDLSVEEIEDGQVLVADDLLSTYGVGDTVGEAVVELLEMFVDYHAELDASRGSLSSFLLRQLRIRDYCLGPLH